MRRILLVVVVAIFQLGCAKEVRGADAFDLEHPVTRADVMISAQVTNAVALFQRGETKWVVESLQTGMQDDVYPQLSPPWQYAVAEMYALAAQSEGLWTEAHRGFKRATASPQASREDWDLRMNSAIGAGDGPDAYLVFRRLVDRREPVLQSLPKSQIDGFDQLIGNLPNAREARLALGGEMEREGWAPDYFYDDASNLWLHYLQILLEDGDLKHAKAVAAKITDPMILTPMHADPRFDVIAAANPGIRDPEAAAQRYLAETKAKAQKNPRSLAALMAVVRALAILNRSEESLPLLEDAALAIAAARHDNDAPFEDPEQARNVELWRTSVLVSLGRWDEAIGGRKTAAACNCSSHDVLALTRTLMGASRSREAQSWLRRAPVEGLNLHERMEMAQIAACVAAQLGDGAELAKQLDFLTAHESWRPEMRVRALVCAGRMEEAARVLIRDLADPRTRLAALSLLQTYAVESGESPYEATLSARWKALTARPDLQAEAAKVGRIDSFSLIQGESVS